MSCRLSRSAVNVRVTKWSWTIWQWLLFTSLGLEPQNVGYDCLVRRSRFTLTEALLVREMNPFAGLVILHWTIEIDVRRIAVMEH